MSHAQIELPQAGVRLASSAGRAVLIDGGRSIDVEHRSRGRFGADVMAALAGWPRFAEWARDQRASEADPVVDPALLGPCVSRPSAVYAIGLNYRDHAEEAGLELPASPMVFTKFPSCLAGPCAEIPLTSDTVDWEVELVVVIGAPAARVPAERTREVIAGYCVGQDISDRRLQFGDRPPQFSLGKSARAYGPIGPALVSLDAIRDPDDLGLWCDVAGERMQESRTSNLIFPIAELVAHLSRYCDLQPGDLIFTGTPAGVGSVRKPRRYLVAGERVTSGIEGLGSLSNLCVEGG